MKNLKLIMGGLIAVALLGLYVYSVVEAVILVESAAAAGIDVEADKLSGMTQALTTIASLISALVVAELAMTPPGEIPLGRVIDSGTSRTTRKSVRWVVSVYLLSWVLTGVAAYIVGQMRHPGDLQPLTDLGQSWLGLAVAATYTYFGIKPSDQPKEKANAPDAPVAGQALPKPV